MEIHDDFFRRVGWYRLVQQMEGKTEVMFCCGGVFFVDLRYNN